MFAHLFKMKWRRGNNREKRQFITCPIYCSYYYFEQQTKSFNFLQLEGALLYIIIHFSIKLVPVVLR